jgi:C-terminal processing protease CtpA/Prc
MKMVSVRFWAAAALLLAATLPVRSQAPPPQQTEGQADTRWAEVITFANWFDGQEFIEYTTTGDQQALAVNSFYALRDPADELFGATLSSVGDAARAQLGIPAGQGLIVSNLRADGPSAAAGLKLHDILLTLSDKPVASSDDLTKLLKAAGDAPATLKLIRAGKPITLQVRPVYRVTLGFVGEEKKEYFIGVSLNPVEEAIRVQLSLPANQGVVVTEVTAGSPAESVGIKPHDILMEYGGKVIDTPEGLAALVQAGQDKPTTIKVVRGGKALSIAVTPAVRKVETTSTADSLRLYAINKKIRLRTAEANVTPPASGYFKIADAIKIADANATPPAADPKALQEQVTKLEKELKAIRESMDKINETLKALSPKK